MLGFATLLRSQIIITTTMAIIMASGLLSTKLWLSITVLCMLNNFCSSFTCYSAQVRPSGATFVGSNLSPYLAQEHRHSTALNVMSDPDEDDIDEERLSDEELQATMGEWDDKIARFNTVHLVGRLGSDPEPKYFDDGKVVLNMSLACKRKVHSMERKTNNIVSGEEETDWYGLEIWGQTAEFVSKYVDKGARVGVIGSLQVDQWSDKATGEPRSRAKVVVRDFDLLETKAEADLRRTNRGGPAFVPKDKSDGNQGGGYGGGPSSAGSGSFFD
jgi:single-strand DNA-binding protein